MTDDVREYIVKSKDLGIFKIKIPSSYKITYSKVIPKASPQYSDSPDYCLRIYEADNKQRAVLNNVVYFRDCSLEIEIKTRDGWEEIKDGDELVRDTVIKMGGEPGEVPTTAAKRDRWNQ